MSRSAWLAGPIGPSTAEKLSRPSQACHHPACRHGDTIVAVASRSAHILPVTGMCVGAGVSEPIVATVSLDRNCNIHSLASGGAHVQPGLVLTSTATI